jgi:hypothetical protein
MLEQADIQLIEDLLSLPEVELMTKHSLKKLQHIRKRVTGKKDGECFCSHIRRKVWFKEFNTWYEANA